MSRKGLVIAAFVLALAGAFSSKFGSDDTFQLDWYEGDANSSHVRALFKVRVSRIP